MEQLIEYFKPEHYQLSLKIDKETEQVEGEAIITGQPYAEAIQLHAKGLKIKRVEVDGEEVNYEYNSDIVKIVSLASVPRTGSLASSKRSALRKDGRAQACSRGALSSNITITIIYAFTLNHNMEGAYLSTYQHQGKTERIITTQFESHYARQCFPCIDEPAAKATFDLTITSTDPEDTIISNMPAQSEQATATAKTVVFSTTPKMSTYLLAFCLGHFQSKSTTSLHGVKITTYAMLSQDKKSLDFPTQVAADTLDYYDDLFGIKYPLPKLDQIAIPDFEAGAMENWGLVTYRESCLLADRHTSISSKSYITTVITHELSHQWFGNLVTMQWWDNLWLNESFASVMQYLAADAIRPELKVWQDFFTGDCYAALHRDALEGVQAVQQPVHSPDEIATLFDGAIVYAKGARLILMLMRLMGQKQFIAGLKSYFKKHQYANATGDDLWSALQPHAKFNVKEFMDAWISQPGCPVLTDGVQQRFLLSGETDQTKWPLPEIKDDMSGHYLLNLSGPEFGQMLSKFDQLSLEQRLRLLIDRELLAKTPLVSSATLMELLPQFRQEASDPVWNIIGSILNDLKIFFVPETPEWYQYKKFVSHIISEQLQRIGVRPKLGEEMNDIKLRSTINGFALYAEDTATIKRLAQLYQDDYTKLPAEIRDDILDAKLRVSNEEVFDTYLERYQATANPNIRNHLLGVLSSAKKPQHIKRLIQLLEQSEIVRPQDHIYLLMDLLYNYKAKAQALEWFYYHRDYIKSITGDKSMDDYLRIVASTVRSDEEAEAFFRFADPLASQPAFQRSVAVAHTSVAARLRLIKDDAPAVHNYLDQHGYSRD